MGSDSVLHTQATDSFQRNAGRVLDNLFGEDTPPQPFNDLGVLGDYEIQGEIARGGMGVVYRARQISLDRSVAIKLIREAVLASEEDRARFQIEAEAAAGIDHPNLVPIHEIGEEDGQLFYSMKLIEGGTLANSPESWKADRREAMRAMAKVAWALQAVHDAGVLHRDLKPGNILLDDEGEPHLTDFGLARKMDGETMLTLSGQVLGTPNYMPPEQARGGKLTTASDVYSFGAVLYQVLTRRPPFQGESVVETLRMVTEDPLDRLDLNDRDLETIVMKCLEKAPGDRYRSAAAVAEDLERWLNHETISARPATRTQRLRKWVRRKPALAAFWATAALLALTLVIGGPLWAINQAKLKGEVETRAELQRQDFYVAEMNRASLAWAEPSGLSSVRAITSRWAGPEHADLRGWEWGFFHNQSLREPPPDIGGWVKEQGYLQAVDWGPEGIAIQRKLTRSLGIIDPNGKQTRIFEEPSNRPNLTFLKFSPDGTRIAAKRQGESMIEIYTIDEEESRLKVTHPQLDKILRALEWSPSGQQLLVLSGGNPLLVLDANNGEILHSIKAGHSIHDAVWDPTDENRIAFVLNKGQLRLRNLEDPNEPFRALNHRLQEKEISKSSLSWSPNGEFLAVNSGRQLELWSPETRKLAIVFEEGPYKPVFAFSPNSRYLAAVVGSAVNVYHVNSQTRVDTLQGHAITPHVIAWSPDGKQIVSMSEDKSVRVWKPKLSKIDKDFHYVIAPSPTTAMSASASHRGLELRNLETGKTRQLANHGQHNQRSLSWSPNGNHIAIGYGSRPTEMQVFSATTGEVELTVPVPLNATEPARILRLGWSPDSHYIVQAGFFPQHRIKVRSFPDGAEIYSQDVAGEEIGWCWTNASDAILLRQRQQLSRIAIPSGEIVAEREALGLTRWMAMHPDGKVAASSADDRVELIDPETLQLLGELAGHSGGVRHLDWSPDGTRLASVGDDDGIRIWDAESRKHLCLLRLPNLVQCDQAWWSHDGRFLVTRDMKGRIHVFDGG